MKMLCLITDVIFRIKIQSVISRFQITKIVIKITGLAVNSKPITMQFIKRLRLFQEVLLIALGQIARPQ